MQGWWRVGGLTIFIAVTGVSDAPAASVGIPNCDGARMLADLLAARQRGDNTRGRQLWRPLSLRKPARLIGLSTLTGQNRQRFAEDARAIYRAARSEDCRSRTISAVAVRIDINPKAHASQP
jgi:hypothetical protein